MEENFSMEWKKIAGMEYWKIIIHFIPSSVQHIYQNFSLLFDQNQMEACTSQTPSDRNR